MLRCGTSFVFHGASRIFLSRILVVRCGVVGLDRTAQHRTVSKKPHRKKSLKNSNTIKHKILEQKIHQQRASYEYARPYIIDVQISFSVRKETKKAIAASARVETAGKILRSATCFFVIIFFYAPP